MNRVDSLLQELATRHADADPRLLAMVRPLVEKLGDPALADPAAAALLQLLTETFERTAELRRGCAAAQAGLPEFLARLRRHSRRT